MRYQDQLVRQTQKALDDVCRSALAVSDDKRDWSPGGAARSVLDQMRELAVAIDWLKPIALDGEVPSFTDHDRLAMREASARLATVEDCVEQARVQVAEWCGIVANFPDERLMDEVVMPFGGGMRMNLADVLGLPAWNMTYHLGQIAFIQLLLGDRAMH